MSELQYFFRLPEAFGKLMRLARNVLGDDRKWRTALSSFKEHYGDVGASLSKFNVSLNEWSIVGRFQKTTDAFLSAMEKHAGGVTAEQKKNWEELLKKAYEDMKSWGWF